MKPLTRNVHAARVDRIVARLQQVVVDGGEVPDLAELAAVAQMSAFHFHRVYRALTSETIGRTLLRLRLLRALHLLADGSTSVTAVALGVGYETPQAFARVFRESFGASPSELRQQPDRMARERERLSRPPCPMAGSLPPLRVDVVSVEPFEVVALRNRGDYADLDQAYGKLFAWATDAGIVDSLCGLYGIPVDDHRDTPSRDMQFDCALAFSTRMPPPSPMRILTVGGGSYARVRHVGSFMQLEDVTDALLVDWLPASGHALRDVPIHYAYLDDPDEVPEAMLRTDIFVPVRSAAAPVK
ncbi:MAG: AraC family transcriptional regulator [Luteimonas sp.]